MVMLTRGAQLFFDSTGGESDNDLFELQQDFPASTTWGRVLFHPQPSGSTNATAAGRFECATLTGIPEEDACQSDLHVVAPPFTFDGQRFSGSFGGANGTTAAFYIQSRQSPVLVPSLAVFSSRDIAFVDEWMLYQNQVDVFAPAPIPEPASLTLLGIGLVFGAARARVLVSGFSLPSHGPRRLHRQIATTVDDQPGVLANA